MAGQKSINLQIANINFSVTAEDKAVLCLIARGFVGFMSAGHKPHLNIRVIVRDDFMDNPYEFGRPHSINVNNLGDYIVCSGTTFTGWLNLGKRRAEVSMPKGISAFYLFLRFVTIIVLSKNQGLVMHASSVAHNGMGSLFSGRPNSGKTTLARLSAHKKVLCDDFSIVKKVGGEFRVFPSPFWGRVKPGGRDENDSYPVRGIYFLYHSDENFIRPFQAWQRKIAALHQNTVFFPTLSSHSRDVFALETELAEKVALYKLYFMPNSSVWRCIDD